MTERSKILHSLRQQSRTRDSPTQQCRSYWLPQVGALVDSVAPGLCPDWDDWDPAENIR